MKEDSPVSKQSLFESVSLSICSPLFLQLTYEWILIDSNWSGRGKPGVKQNLLRQYFWVV